MDVRFGVACLAVLGFGVVGFAASRRFRVVVGQTAWVWWHLGAVGLLGAGVWGHVVQGRGFVAQAGVVIGLGVAYRGFRGLRGWKAV